MFADFDHFVIHATLRTRMFFDFSACGCARSRSFTFNIHQSTLCFPAAVRAEDDEVDVDGTVEEDLGKSRDGSRTDDEVVQRWVAHGQCTILVSPS